MIITGKRRRSLSYLYPWQHRVCIDNKQNSSDLEDYQIKVSITDSGMIAKMKEDGGDIRFYAGLTKLSYWIEKKTSSEMVVWVKFPEIPGSSTTRIYMYYGNPSASSESNGETVFEFFDDFEGTSLDTNWDTTDITVLGVSNSYVHLKASLGAGRYMTYKGKTFGRDIIVEAKGRSSGANPTIGVALDKSNNALDDGYACQYIGYDDASQRALVVKVASTPNKKATDLGQPTQDSIIKGIVTSDGKVRVEYYGWDGKNGSYEITNNDYQSGRVGLAVIWDDKEEYYDWIRVRKYTDPEPTITIEN